MLQFAKKAIQKQNEAVTIISLLDKRLAGREEARPHGTVRVSMLTKLTGFCPREFALLDKVHKKQRDEFVSTAMRVAFDNGHALEDLVRNKWLGEDVVGDWQCLGCNHKIIFAKKPKVKCAKCERDLWEYREHTLVDPVTRTHGNIDFFLDMNKGKHVICECKSIAKDEFNDLKGPLAEHKARSLCYIALAAKSESPYKPRIDLTHARILYISKGFGQKQQGLNKILPFKEFIVERDDAAAEPYFAKAGLYQAFRDGGPMPVGICSTGFDKRSHNCMVAKECFSGQFPAGK